MFCLIFVHKACLESPLQLVLLRHLVEVDHFNGLMTILYANKFVHLLVITHRLEIFVLVFKSLEEALCVEWLGTVLIEWRLLRFYCCQHRSLVFMLANVIYCSLVVHVWRRWWYHGVVSRHQRLVCNSRILHQNVLVIREDNLEVSARSLLIIIMSSLVVWGRNAQSPSWILKFWRKRVHSVESGLLKLVGEKTLSHTIFMIRIIWFTCLIRG